MKKALGIIALCFALLFTVPVVSADAQLFDKGDMVLTAGMGLGATYYSLGGTSMVMPVIFAAGDYCLREDLGPGNLGVGAFIGYSSYKDKFYLSDDYYWKVSSFMIGARGTYHFTDLVDKLDLYGGITVGGEIVSVKSSDDALDGYSSPSNSNLLEEIFAGAHYYFADNISVTGELGYGVSWLKLGISFKL